MLPERAPWERWLVGIALLVGPYILLGRGLMEGKKLEKRTYRYAE